MVDTVSGLGLHWPTRADAAQWMKQSDGEPWEQAFRAAAKEIAARTPNMDVSFKDKVFTFTPAKSNTTWP